MAKPGPVGTETFSHSTGEDADSGTGSCAGSCCCASCCTPPSICGEIIIDGHLGGGGGGGGIGQGSGGCPGNIEPSFCSVGSGTGSGGRDGINGSRVAGAPAESPAVDAGAAVAAGRGAEAGKVLPPARLAATTAVAASIRTPLTSAGEGEAEAETAVTAAAGADGANADDDDPEAGDGATPPKA
jgi:hypothetical protein